MNSISTMIREDFTHVNAISIKQHGKTLLKEFYNGHKSVETYYIGCIFKSFISALVGIAIKEEKIQSLEEKLINYYQEINLKDIDKSFPLLTLQEVMTKTSGIIWPGIGEELPQSMHEVWRLKFKNIPGENFEYKPDPQIIIYLLEDLYEKDIISIANENLFKPLGISKWEWTRDDIEGMSISVDDLEIFGQLYLNKGMYKGKCFFTEEFYKNSIYPYSSGGFPEGKPYGYYWWIDKYHGIEYFSACGFGGQKLCIIPSIEASIVIISEMDRPHLENNVIIRNIFSLL